MAEIHQNPVAQQAMQMIQKFTDSAKAAFQNIARTLQDIAKQFGGAQSVLSGDISHANLSNLPAPPAHIMSQDRVQQINAAQQASRTA